MNTGVANAETEMSDSATEVCLMELKPSYGEYTDRVPSCLLLQSLWLGCLSPIPWKGQHTSSAFSAGRVNVLHAQTLSILCVT